MQKLPVMERLKWPSMHSKEAQDPTCFLVFWGFFYISKKMKQLASSVQGCAEKQVLCYMLHPQSVQGWRQNTQIWVKALRTHEGYWEPCFKLKHTAILRCWSWLFSIFVAKIRKAKVVRKKHSRWFSEQVHFKCGVGLISCCFACGICGSLPRAALEEPNFKEVKVNCTQNQRYMCILCNQYWKSYLSWVFWHKSENHRGLAIVLEPTDTSK